MEAFTNLYLILVDLYDKTETEKEEIIKNYYVLSDTITSHIGDSKVEEELMSYINSNIDAIYNECKFEHNLYSFLIDKISIYDSSEHYYRIMYEILNSMTEVREGRRAYFQKFISQFNDLTKVLREGLYDGYVSTCTSDDKSRLLEKVK